LRKAQAQAGDITLLFVDESEALTHPYLAQAWAKRGADLRIQAPGQATKVAMMGALDALTRELIVHTSRTKRSSDFVALLDAIEGRYGPRSGRRVPPPVLVLDHGRIHTSRLTTQALAARPWLTLEWLPKYAPELNDLEPAWRDLKRHHLAHRTFPDADDLEATIHRSVCDRNRERARTLSCDNPTKRCLGLLRRHSRYGPRVAQPPKAAFVARLQPAQWPEQTAGQLPEQTDTSLGGTSLHG